MNSTEILTQGEIKYKNFQPKNVHYTQCTTLLLLITPTFFVGSPPPLAAPKLEHRVSITYITFLS